jgi:hypothetical protein
MFVIMNKRLNRSKLVMYWLCTSLWSRTKTAVVPGRMLGNVRPHKRQCSSMQLFEYATGNVRVCNYLLHILINLPWPRQIDNHPALPSHWCDKWLDLWYNQIQYPSLLWGRTLPVLNMSIYHASVHMEIKYRVIGQIVKITCRCNLFRLNFKLEWIKSTSDTFLTCIFIIIIV